MEDWDTKDLLPRRKKMGPDAHDEDSDAVHDPSEGQIERRSRC
jgi:hypothetical protein